MSAQSEYTAAISMLYTSIGIILGIVASLLKIVNGIVDLIKKMPRKAK